MKRILIALVALLPLSCAQKESTPAKEATKLEISEEEIEVWSDTETGTVLFTCDGSWTAESGTSWITVCKPSGKGSDSEQTLEFNPDMNITGKTRSGVISIEAADGELYATVIIRQSGVAEHSVSNFLRQLAADNADGLKRVAICAHRANSWSGIWDKGDCPENSVPAIERCIELGFDMVELDLCETSDGVIVCSHDTYISNVTNGTGNIASMTYSDICKYDMKLRSGKKTVVKGLHMARFEDALAAAKDKIFINLDLTKMDISVSKIVGMISDAGMLDQVVCYTGSDSDAAWKFYDADNRLDPHLSISTPGSATIFKGVQTTPLFQISTSRYYGGTSVDTKTINGIHSAGYCCFSNTLDYDEYIRTFGPQGTACLAAFLDAGIDFMQTDYGDCENIQTTLKNYR